MSQLAENDILDLLASLVDKSLVIHEGGLEGPGRYSMLETVRQYALEEITESRQHEAVRDRQLAFFLSLVEEAQARMTGPDRVAILERLDPDYENLLVALDWALSGSGDKNRSLRLAVGLSPYWYSRGHLAAARSCLSAALAAGNPEVLLLRRAAALNQAGNFAKFQEDLGAAREQYEQSLAIRRRCGDDVGAAHTLCNLGSLAFFSSDHRRARDFIGEALSTFRALDDNRGVAEALGLLGELARTERDLESAESLLSESVELWRDIGDPGFLSWRLLDLGLVALHRHDERTARSLLREAAEIWRRLHDRLGVVCILEALGALAWAQRDPRLAARLFGSAESLRERVGAPMGSIDREDYTPFLTGVEESLGGDEFDREWAAGRATPWEQAMDGALAWLACDEGAKRVDEP